jgi:glycerophosphoryl diester phosphodiesterase
MTASRRPVLRKSYIRKGSGIGNLGESTEYSRRDESGSISPSMKIPWIIAHRGGAAHAPENTLAAFEKSVALGVPFLETDLQLTRDARFVAIHDSTLDRTTNGTGPVHGMTLPEIRGYDAGLWFDRGFAGERVPTLEELLEFAGKHDVVFYLELKYDFSWGMHSSLVAALRQSNSISRTIVICFDAKTLSEIRKIDESVMTGLLVEDGERDPVEAAVNAGARQLCPVSTIVTPELVKRAHGADLQVATWTVNHREEMEEMIAAGVDGIITDFPDRLRAVVEGLQNPASSVHSQDH